jgi:hypothetical protein
MATQQEDIISELNKENRRLQEERRQIQKELEALKRQAFRTSLGCYQPTVV